METACFYDFGYRLPFSNIIGVKGIHATIIRKQ